MTGLGMTGLGMTGLALISFALAGSGECRQARDGKVR